jgi:hypothetical protein
MNAPSIPAPSGRWWLAYDDGAVWPCEVRRSFFPGHWTVVPQAPAPDAGTERVEPTGRIYDSSFNRPTLKMQEAAQ